MTENIEMYQIYSNYRKIGILDVGIFELDSLYGLMPVSWQIVTIWFIQTTRDASTKKQPWSAE